MRKGERKKQDIIQVAAAMFARKGYAGTAIQDILDELACSKGSFYHHFDTKFDVLLAITQAQAAQARARYQATVATSPLSSLNALLLQASFLSGHHQPLLDSLASLRGSYEGFAMLSVMQEAVESQFLPLFESVMDALRTSELALYTDQASLRVVFAGFLTACAQLYPPLSLQPPDIHAALPILRAIRRTMEAALGMQPGSIVILGLDTLRGRASEQAPV